MSSLSSYTVVELKDKAKKKGLVGYSKLRKDELIKLLSQGDRSTRSKSVSRGSIRSRSRSTVTVRSEPKHIAFCFLLYDKIDHLSIWEEFFSQDAHHTANIYSHVKKVTSDTPKWIRDVMVKTVPTSWCGDGITIGFNQMLIEALKDPKNTHFCFLSGSDIPLYTYPETYKKITSTSKSRINYMKEYENVFKDRGDIYNAHNWVILNRQNAEDYIRLGDENDKKAMKFVQKFKELYAENGVHIKDLGKDAVVDKENSWVGSCPDETYPINWLIELYGGHTSKKFKSLIMRALPTYSYWDFEKDPKHPRIFDLKSVKRYKKEICGDSIFARKFTPDAAHFISMGCGGKGR